MFLIIVTPILLRTIGTQGYGFWVFTYVIAGFGGICNLGMPIATQRFVAHSIGKSTNSKTAGNVHDVIVNAFVVAMVGGVCIAIPLVFFSGRLASITFQNMEPFASTQLAIEVGAAILLCQIAESIFGSALRGLERFDLSAKAEIAARGLTAVSIFISVLAAPATNVVLLATLLGAFVSIWIKFSALRSATIFGLKRTVTKGPTKLLRFGIWIWLQGIGSTVFQHADRMVLPALLGTSALATYSVAGQLGAVIHLGLAGLFAVILPNLTRELASSSPSERHALFCTRRSKAIIANVILVSVLGSSFWLLGPSLLQLWLGPTVPYEVTDNYHWILAAYLLLALNIAPHFLLLSLGKAKEMAFITMTAAIIAILILYPAVSTFGLPGAAVSRCLYAAVVLIGYILLIVRQQL
jgi:O-antigen/teichoic acid export membrane protein